VSEPAEQIERSAALIERLLRDPELRRRFRADPGAVLDDHGLPELGGQMRNGGRALLTLESRESRSSLAGVMVAAAAEGVDFAHVAERAAPGLEHDAGQAVDRFVRSLSRHPHPHHRASAPGKAKLEAGANIPPLASDAPASAPSGAGPATAQAGAPVGAGQAGAAAGAGQAGGAAVAGQAGAPVGAGQAGPPAGAGQVELPQRPPSGPGSWGQQDPPAHLRARSAHFHENPGAPADVPVAPGSHWDVLRYPGDAAAPRQIAAWMGATARRAGLPAELPVMAALTESGMRNLPYGDADSVGYFQMRSGIWDHGPYAGYLQHPELQLSWFIEHALAARSQDPALAQGSDGWGEWIANVEQPAAQYRYRYQLQLDAARELLRGAELTPAPAPVHHISVGVEALHVALHYLGTPYQWGGSSPSTGFDCSGLVQFAYSHEGIRLPRVAADQFNVGIHVPRDDLRPGDAVFFADSTGYVHHVGMYVGNGRFVNAPQTGEDVKISSLSDPYFAAQYAGARRYTAAALGDPSKYARTLPTVKG
jgi:NlpC/P60 family